MLEADQEALALGVLGHGTDKEHVGVLLRQNDLSLVCSPEAGRASGKLRAGRVLGSFATTVNLTQADAAPVAGHRVLPDSLRGLQGNDRRRRSNLGALEGETIRIVPAYHRQRRYFLRARGHEWPPSGHRRLCHRLLGYCPRSNFAVRVGQSNPDLERTGVALVEQPQQESYRHKDYKDHRKREEAQPAPFHTGCASSLAALTDRYSL